MEVDIVQDRSQILEQVSKILNSSLFMGSIILKDFLTYIVKETLNGNEDGLKEYVIATNVLKKDEDFNPQVSAIVRIHARRLRKRLDDYYATEGEKDTIRMSVPKGRYIPVFETANPSDSSGKIENNMVIQDGDWKPVIAVLPCTRLNHPEKIEVISTVLFRDISMKLTKASEIGVLPYSTAQKAYERLGTFSEMGSQLGVDYILTGTCLLEGEQVKFSFELIALNKMQLLWAESFKLKLGKKFESLEYINIIRKVIAMTCGYRGLIYQDLFINTEPQDYGKYYALYWHNYYHQRFSEEAFHTTMNAVEVGLEKNPENSLLLAFKGELFLNLLAMGVQGDIDYLKLGTQFVEKAIGINQNCQHAYQVLAWSQMLQHDKEEFVRAIEKTISINPNDVMYSGSAGFGYICMGEYEKGLDLMSEALSLNPHYPWNLSIAFCLYYLVHEEYKEALYWAKMINRKALFWDPLLRCSLLGYVGRTDEALDAYSELISLVPDFADRAPKLVAVFLLEENLQSSILNGFGLAGIELTGK